MSTQYAVAMPLPEFLVEARKLGFKMDAVVGPVIRLRLMDDNGGCAFDPHQETANDGTIWTLFTRHGGNDVSGLAGPLNAIDEYSDEFILRFVDDQDDALVLRGVSMFFEQNAVEPRAVQHFCRLVLDTALQYRADQRSWAAGHEDEPLPRVIVDCPGCGWPWPGGQDAP